MGQNQSHGRPTELIPPPNYDLPPMTFHSTHGANITLSNDGSLGMISHEKSLTTIFGHKHNMKNVNKKFGIFQEKISTAFGFGLYLE